MRKNSNRAVLIVCIAVFVVASINVTKVKHLRLVDAVSLVAMGLAAGAIIACIAVMVIQRARRGR